MHVMAEQEKNVSPLILSDAVAEAGEKGTDRWLNALTSTHLPFKTGAKAGGRGRVAGRRQTFDPFSRA